LLAGPDRFKDAWFALFLNYSIRRRRLYCARDSLPRRKSDWSHFAWMRLFKPRLDQSAFFVIDITKRRAIQ
jgi:hypothetical protein